MANGFGALWVGASGIQGAGNALNTTANNLSNVNSQGYVRQQVIFEDNEYHWFGSAAVSDQYAGLGVSIGEVLHTRDIFLDNSFRTSSARQAFYETNYDAVSEVETFLQESQGQAFQISIDDIYEAFSEFAKDPSDSVNQNLILQKSNLFLTRAQAVYQGLSDFQDINNTGIKNSVDRINEIGKEIFKLNTQIQRIEAGKVETAMDLRDTRDNLLDELASLTKISYSETIDGKVKVQVEGVQFVDEARVHEMGLWKDDLTGFYTPYWPHLSDTNKPVPDVDYVYNLSNIDASKGNDSGKIKALLLARGDERATYLSMEDMSPWRFTHGTKKQASMTDSVMQKAESELDKLVHSIVTQINDTLSPTASLKDVYGYTGNITGKDADGNEVVINENELVLDVNNCPVGSDMKLPPQELFVRRGCDRYTEVTIADPATGEEKKVWVYNEEDPEDTTKCYTLNSISMNHALMENETLIPYKSQNGDIDYHMSASLETMWDQQNYFLNPTDTTPCSIRDFYNKWVGEVGTNGSVYYTTSETLKSTVKEVEQARQGVIGVSSDEELTNMIKYQNAYNASSRFINAVSEMIEHLITQL